MKFGNMIDIVFMTAIGNGIIKQMYDRLEWKVVGAAIVDRCFKNCHISAWVALIDNLGHL